MVDQPGDRGDGSNGGDRHPTKNHQIALSIDALTRTYDSSQAQNDDKQNKILFWSRCGAIATILYTFLTVIISYAGIRAAIEARLAASAAATQNEISLRPYVRINIDQNSFRISQLPNTAIDQGISIQFTVGNYGKLPANLTLQSGILWSDPRHPRQPGMPQATSNVGARFIFPVDPEDRLTAYGPPLGAGDLTDLSNNVRRNLFVIVAALYGPKDNPARYVTSVCMYYQITGSGRDLHLQNGEPCPEEEPKSFLR